MFHNGSFLINVLPAEWFQFVMSTRWKCSLVMIMCDITACAGVLLYQRQIIDIDYYYSRTVFLKLDPKKIIYSLYHLFIVSQYVLTVSSVLLLAVKYLHLYFACSQLVSCCKSQKHVFLISLCSVSVLIRFLFFCTADYRSLFFRLEIEQIVGKVKGRRVSYYQIISNNYDAVHY